MSWLSSILHTVEKTVIRPIAPTLLTATAVAGLGAITGGAAFGTASILGGLKAITGGSSGSSQPSAGTVSPAMGLLPSLPTAGDVSAAAGGLQVGAQVSAQAAGDYAGAVTGGALSGAENYLSAASHNIRNEGVKFAIYAALILFMLAAFAALLMPDEQQIINIAKIAGETE